MSDEPRKSKAQRKVESLTERQRKIEAEILAAQNELKLENEREKEQQGSAAFVACVRRLGRGRLDSLRATVFGEFDADDAQIVLVKDWFDSLLNTHSTQAATDILDRAKVFAVGAPRNDAITATPVGQLAASDSASPPRNSPSENPILPTGEASAKPGDNHHQADAAQTNQTLPGPAVRHDDHQASAVVLNKPLLIKDRTVEPGDHIQVADKATPGGVPPEISLDAMSGKPAAAANAEARTSAAASEDLSVISEVIKDRLWRGDYLIEVEEKGGCQVIGMKAFRTPEDAMEHLAWLEAGARNGDESAKQVLATAAKAASEHQVKSPRTIDVDPDHPAEDKPQV